MAYPEIPEKGESFETWIRPKVDELLDEEIARVRAEVAEGKLLSQVEQLNVLDQLIKDRRDRAALIERGKVPLQ